MNEITEAMITQTIAYILMCIAIVMIYRYAIEMLHLQRRKKYYLKCIDSEMKDIYELLKERIVFVKAGGGNEKS